MCVMPWHGSTGKMKINLAALIVLMAGACDRHDAAMKVRTASLHGTTYQFPQGHISAAVFPPDGRLFVRLTPPGEVFDLVLDEWGDRPTGHPGIPIISRLTDRFGEFDVNPSEGGPVVCSRGAQPHYNCGIQISDGPVKWGVLFDKKYVPEAREIRTRATAVIQGYRFAR